VATSLSHVHVILRRQVPDRLPFAPRVVTRRWQWVFDQCTGPSRCCRGQYLADSPCLGR